MFFILRFSLAWFVWLLCADKFRWRSLGLIGIFAALLGSIADIIIYHYPFWAYPSSDNTLFIDLSDNLSIYIVAAYLFVQWLPNNQCFSRMFSYWFIWTAIALVIEWLHLKLGYMSYNLGWTLTISYFTNWIFFTVLYTIYRVFRLEKLDSF